MTGAPLPEIRSSRHARPTNRSPAWGCPTWHRELHPLDPFDYGGDELLGPDLRDGERDRGLADTSPLVLCIDHEAPETDRRPFRRRYAKRFVVEHDEADRLPPGDRSLGTTLPAQTVSVPGIRRLAPRTTLGLAPLRALRSCGRSRQ